MTIGSVTNLPDDGNTWDVFVRVRAVKQGEKTAGPILAETSRVRADERGTAVLNEEIEVPADPTDQIILTVWDDEQSESFFNLSAYMESVRLIGRGAILLRPHRRDLARGEIISIREKLTLFLNPAGEENEEELEQEDLVYIDVQFMLPSMSDAPSSGGGGVPPASDTDGGGGGGDGNDTESISSPAPAPKPAPKAIPKTASGHAAF